MYQLFKDINCSFYVRVKQNLKKVQRLMKEIENTEFSK